MKRFIITLVVLAAAFFGLDRKYHYFRPTVTELVVKPGPDVLARLDSGQTVQLCPMFRIKSTDKLKIAVPYDTLPACKAEYMSLPDSEKYEVTHGDKFPSIDMGPIQWRLEEDSLGHDVPKATTMDKPKEAVAT